jgi:hypothetical protein
MFSAFLLNGSFSLKSTNTNNGMGIMKLSKLLFYSTFLLLATGCGGKYIDPYPQLVTNIEKVSSINIVADYTIYEDIAGDDLGVNIEKNKAAEEDLKTDIVAFFNEKNISTNFLHIGSGLFIKEVDDEDTGTINDAKSDEPNKVDKNQTEPNVFYSAGFKSTGEEFAGYATSNNSLDGATQSQLRDILQKSNKHVPKLEEGQEQVDPVIFSDIADQLKANDADHLLILSSNTIDVSKAKSIGLAFTTSLASLLLSGGTYISTTSVVSQTTNTVLLLDVNSGELIWSGNGVGGDSKPVGSTAMITLEKLYKEIERKRERQAKNK